MQIRKTAVVIILLLILLLQVGLRLPFLHVPLDRDEGAYGYMAQRILAGEVPYRDAFDHKPPLVYFIYASLVKLFGNSISAIRVPTLLYSLLTTVALFYLGFLLLGAGGGLLAAFLYALFSGGILIQGASSNTETFMVLPLILAFCCFLLSGKMREDQGKSGKIRMGMIFLAGLFSGIAIMIKQVAVFNFVVLLGFLLFDKVQSPKSKVACAGDIGQKTLDVGLRVLLGVWILMFGFLVFPLLFTLYFLLKGAFSDYIYDVFLVNRQYLRSLPFGPLARMINGIYTTFVIAKLENSILWVFGLTGLFCIFFKDRLKQNLLLAFWSLASIVAVAASGLFFGHYYIQLIPALCLLSAYAIKRITKEAGFLLKAAIVLVALFLVFSIIPYQYPVYFKFTLEQVSERQYGKLSYVISYKLAQKLKELMKPQEKIFVWAANPEMYFYLEKKSPTRFYNYLGWMESEENKQEIVRSVIKERPEYMIWTDYNFRYNELVDFVEGEYRLFMMIGNWKVFKIIK
ncbi:MAG: glycosyltransferase family 39 protein [Candidatus Margulisiibacteriota bacterium]